MVVLVIAALVLASAVLLLQFLQGGSLGFVYAAMVLAAAAVFLPDLARSIGRRRAGGAPSAPEPVGDLTAADRPSAPARVEPIEGVVAQPDDSPTQAAEGAATDPPPADLVPVELVVRPPDPEADVPPPTDPVASPTEPAATIGEPFVILEPRTDGPDFAAEPVFDSGPVVAAPPSRIPADAAADPTAGSEAEPAASDEEDERLARMETTVAALMQRIGALADTVAQGDQTTDTDSRPSAWGSERPHAANTTGLSLLRDPDDQDEEGSRRTPA